MEELRSRLDEKDSTLEKSRRQLSTLKAEKAGLDEEKTELGEALDIKEKKISLLQVRKKEVKLKLSIITTVTRLTNK